MLLPLNGEEFAHKFIKGESNKVLLLLHGTGGDENDLIPLARFLAPNMSFLSLRGNVSEDGMLRFFIRYETGIFDQENMLTETQKLNSFIDWASNEYGFKLDDLIFFGYSNGANFALSYLFRYPSKISRGVILHPQIPFIPDSPIDLSTTKLLVTSGKHDPYSTEENMQILQEVLESNKAELIQYRNDGGHEMTEGEINEVKDFFTDIA